MKNRGFTLIELLVVIAIIGVISSVVLVALGKARIKARDTSRLVEAKQIQNALELYFAKNNVYPGNVDTWYDSACTSDGGTYYADLNPFISEFITLPPDPNGSGCIWYIKQPSTSNAETGAVNAPYLLLVLTEDRPSAVQSWCYYPDDPWYHCIVFK